MDYKSCKYYSQGYCLKGEKTASGMNYPASSVTTARR